jgi:hypothetical protein
MGTTPNQHLPYPVPEDSADIPRDIKALADALDALFAVTGAALPASPVDGQEFFYQLAGNAGRWHLRYNAGYADAYKWDVLGGPDLAAMLYAETQFNPGNSQFVKVAAPQLDLPLKGIYHVAYGFPHIYMTGGFAQGTIFLANVDKSDRTICGSQAAGPSGYHNCHAVATNLEVAAPSPVNLGGYATAVAACMNMYLRAQPVRVG